MSRVEEYFRLLRNRSRSRITPGEPDDDALLALLVHMAFSDGDVHDQELAFLHRMLPGRDPEALRTWVRDVTSVPLPFEAIASALPSPDDRWKGLRFAARMAWSDGEVHPNERSLLDQLAVALELPDGAVERVLREMTHGRMERVSSDRLVSALESMGWGAVQFAGGQLCSPDLVGLVPEGATIVRRVGVDAVELMGIYEEGLVARFQEGAAFLHWRDIVAWTMGHGVGDGLSLHTEEGRVFTLVDRRASGVRALLDRILNHEG